MATIKELRSDKQKFRGEHAKFVEICNLLGTKLRENGEFNDAIAEHQIAIETCSLKIRTPKIARELEAISRRALGECYSEAGEHELAKEEHDRYLALAKQMNDPIEIQRAHATIGRTFLLCANDSHKNRDILFKSAASFKRALDLCEQLKSVGKLRLREYADMKSRLLLNLALVYEELADFTKCQRLLLESIELTKSNYLQEDLFRCQLSLGSIHERQDNLNEAQQYYQAAYCTAKSLKSRTKKVDSLHCLGLIAVKRSELDGARSKFKRAFLLKSPVDRLESERLLRVVTVLREDVRHAKKLEAALTSGEDQDGSQLSGEELKNSEILMKLYDRIGDHFCELKCFAPAIDSYKSELKIAHRCGRTGEELAKIYVSIGATCQDANRFEEAIENFRHEQNLQNNLLEKAETSLKICDLYECHARATIDEFDYDERDKNRDRILQAFQQTFTILDSTAFLQQAEDGKMNFENPIVRRELDLHRRISSAFLKASRKHHFTCSATIREREEQLRRIERIVEQHPKGDQSEDEEEEREDSGGSQTSVEELYKSLRFEKLSSCSSNSDDDDEEETLAENVKNSVAKKRNPHQAKVSKLNQFGETPLHTACIAGNIGQVERLLEQKAPLNAKDYCGWAPLHEACNHGHGEVVEALLKAGANIEISDERSERITPLHDACSCGNVQVITILLKYRANVLAKNSKGDTPIECLIDYRKRTKLRDEEERELDELERRLLKEMQSRGWNDFDKICVKRNSNKNPASTQQSRTVRSTLRARNIKSRDIYSDEEDDDDEALDRTEMEDNRKRNMNKAQDAQDDVFDLDKAGNARQEYRRTMEQLGRKNRSAQECGRRTVLLTGSDNQKALIEKDVVRDDWLIDDLNGGVNEMKKNKRRMNENSSSNCGVGGTKTKKLKIHESDDDCDDKDNGTKSTTRIATFDNDVDDVDNDYQDDFDDYLDVIGSRFEDNLKHINESSSAGSASYQRKNFNSISITSSAISTARKENASKTIPLTRTKSSDVVMVHKNDAIIVGTPSEELLPQTSNGAHDAQQRQRNQLVTVKFNDPERSSFALPITRREQTVDWLRDELQRRYFRKFGVKPVISLQTAEGALLSDEDSVQDIIQIKDILLAHIDSYTTEEPSKRYTDLCRENSLEPDAQLEKMLRKCSQELCFRLENAFWSVTNIQARILFQALQRQEINEISLKFTNSLLGVSGLTTTAVNGGSVGVGATTGGWDCFLKLVPTLPRLQSLSLVGVSLPRGAIVSLLNLTPALRRLDLSWNSIGDEQCYALAQIVTLYDRLTILALNGCDLSENIFANKLFIQAISKSTCLDSVELDYNEGIDEQLIAKFKNLRQDRGFLRELILA